MALEEDISQVSSELDALSSELDGVLSQEEICDSDLQRIGQKERELSERLKQLERAAKLHAVLEKMTAEARGKADGIRGRL